MTDTGVYLLIEAIVKLACNDIRNIKNKDCRKYKDAKRFLLSDWFTTLTGLDGKMILERLEKEKIQ